MPSPIWIINQLINLIINYIHPHHPNSINGPLTATTGAQTLRPEIEQTNKLSQRTNASAALRVDCHSAQIACVWNELETQESWKWFQIIETDTKIDIAKTVARDETMISQTSNLFGFSHDNISRVKHSNSFINK